MILPLGPETFPFYKRRIFNFDIMQMTNYPTSLKCDNVCSNGRVSLQRGEMSVFLLKYFVNYSLKIRTRIRTSVTFFLICYDYTIRESLAIYRGV